jgi:Tol biopolymer transport system component
MRTWIGAAIISIALAACSVTETDSPATRNPAVQTGETATSAESTADGESQEPSSLTGRLIFADDVRGVQQYDFATGDITTIFEPADHAITRNLSVSPDGTQIAFSYAPPPPDDNSLQFGFTDLYTMPVDGSTDPVPLLEGDNESELFFLPSWSNDGTYLYYSHIVPNPDEEGASLVRIERLIYPDGEPEVLVTNGFSPRFSPDGTKMVYVARDRETNRDDVFVANADGTDPINILDNNLFLAIDSPLFTPDGESVIISAVTSDVEGKSDDAPFYVDILDWLLGAQVVEAHTVPSDLWILPATGGLATQITHIYAVNLWPEFSPDGETLALLSVSRIYLMNPDGTNVTTLLDEGASGTMDWIP